MARGNRRSAAGGGSSEFCFEEGSQSADIKYPLIGLSRRCIPSWVSRAHPSLPSRKIYHFIDSLSGTRISVCRFLTVKGPGLSGETLDGSAGELSFSEFERGM